MKRLLFPLFLLFPIALLAQTAKIKIDIDRTIAEIDPKIYGAFMEPIQFTGKEQGLPDTGSLNTLYGSLYDPASPLANESGFRKDYIEAMKELKITNMRWPGGNYVMAYNWQDGIGPRNKRPARINLAWNGVDTNHVGTDEWVELNKAKEVKMSSASTLVSARSMTRAIGLNTAITAKAPTIPICAPRTDMSNRTI